MDFFEALPIFLDAVYGSGEFRNFMVDYLEVLLAFLGYFVITCIFLIFFIELPAIYRFLLGWADDAPTMWQHFKTMSKLIFAYIGRLADLPGATQFIMAKNTNAGREFDRLLGVLYRASKGRLLLPLAGRLGLILFGILLLLFSYAIVDFAIQIFTLSGRREYLSLSANAVEFSEPVKQAAGALVYHMSYFGLLALSLVILCGYLLIIGSVFKWFLQAAKVVSVLLLFLFICSGVLWTMVYSFVPDVQPYVAEAAGLILEEKTYP